MAARRGAHDASASCPTTSPAKAKQLRELRAHVAGALERAPWLRRSGSRMVGIGGTMRNLAAAAQREADIAEFGVQGFVLTRDALDALVDELADLPPSERGSVPGIKPARADIILGGALVVQAVMEEGGFEAIDVTEAGLREGVFFERYLARRNGGEALFDDVRRASVVNLAAQYGMNPDLNPHVAHVARLALELFDELAAAGLHPGDQRRARAALGGGAAARHRDDDRLRRPPQALALPRPQRGAAGLRAARGRAHRPGGALPPQGHAVARARSPRSRTRATRSA